MTDTLQLPGLNLVFEVAAWGILGLPWCDGWAMRLAGTLVVLLR